MLGGIAASNGDTKSSALGIANLVFELKIIYLHPCSEMLGGCPRMGFAVASSVLAQPPRFKLSGALLWAVFRVKKRVYKK